VGVEKMNTEKADEWGPLVAAAGEGKRGAWVNSARLTRGAKWQRLLAGLTGARSWVAYWAGLLGRVHAR